MKIDEKTVVPVGWVLSGFAFFLSVTGIGAFWVATVSFRLERIEEKLGIPPYQSNTSLLGKAYAEVSRKYRHE